MEDIPRKIQLLIDLHRKYSKEVESTLLNILIHEQILKEKRGVVNGNESSITPNTDNTSTGEISTVEISGGEDKDTSRETSSRGESSRGKSSRGESSRRESSRGESSRGKSLRGEPSRGESSRGKSLRGEPSRGESPRGKSSRGESSRGESSRGESSRMETRGRSVRPLFEQEKANHGVGKRKRPESWSINNTKKKLEFTGAPIGGKGVAELPGIGPIKARLFIAAGYSKAIQVFGKFLETDKDGFMKFLKDTGKMEGNNAGRLYDTLMDYKNQFLT